MNNDDIGAGLISLRDAIAAANSTSGSDIIEFDSSLSRTIALSEGQLLITESVTITGLGADIITIGAQNNSCVFKISDSNRSTLQTVAISGITITGGKASNGGGIFNTETLSVTNRTLSSNSAQIRGGFGLRMVLA